MIIGKVSFTAPFPISDAKKKGRMQRFCFGGADIGAQGSRPKDSVLRPKEFLISAPRAPQRFFAAPQELPEGFFAYPKATKGFSGKIIKQILISLGDKVGVALHVFFGMGSCGSSNLLWVIRVVP